MQVLFLQNIKGTAQIGDIKDVADGYGRYLITNKLAKKADRGAMKESENLAKKRELAREKQDQWAKEVMEKVTDLVLTMEADANQEGHLYGSIDAKAIVAAANEHGLNLKVNDVILPHGLKEIGEHEVQLDLTTEHKATLKINITKKSA